MSEMRDLLRDKANIMTVVETWSDGHGPTQLELIALHAIDRALAAEKEVVRLIAWHNRETQLIIADKKEIEQERDELRKQLEWQTKELNRLRILEQGLSDFQNDMLPNDTAENVYAWIESTAGFKNIYRERPNEQN